MTDTSHCQVCGEPRTPHKYHECSHPKDPQAELREAIEAILWEVRTDVDYDADGNKIPEIGNVYYADQILQIFQAREQKILDNMLEIAHDQLELRFGSKNMKPQLSFGLPHATQSILALIKLQQEALLDKVLDLLPSEEAEQSESVYQARTAIDKLRLEL